MRWQLCWEKNIETRLPFYQGLRYNNIAATAWLRAMHCMKRKIIHDLSASAIQVALNQVLGLTVFLVCSRYLQKPVYGELNWSLAILTFLFTALSLRLEQVTVRKIAAGEDAGKMLTLFSGHTIGAGLFFYVALIVAGWLLPSFFGQHDILPLLAISQLLSFFSLPFKHVANGKEAFGLLAVMSSVANSIRTVWLLLVLLFSQLTLGTLLLVYIVSSAAELLFCLFITRYRLMTRISLRWRIKDYSALLKESLPQVGAVLMNAAVARLDWILLGLFSSALITADYSFAYRIFEICPVPMLVIGPVLLARFSRYFSTNDETSLLQKKELLAFFIRYAMIAATALSLLLNMVWTPLVDNLTQNKYGASASTIFLLLSFSIPFQYMINLLWTIHFAQNRLKLVFRVTSVTCLVIACGDLLAIPLWNATGAAVVYLIATIVEYILYLRVSVLLKIKESWRSLLICIAIAVLSGGFAILVHDDVVMKLLVAIGLYIVLLLLTGQIKITDRDIIRQWIPGKKKNQVKELAVPAE